jgi:ribokinase
MTPPTPTPNIAVIGSLNVDTIYRVSHFPEVGATVAATDVQRRFGGKGANQALAAARQGAQVSMICSVGNDGEGNSYLDYLAAQGLNVSGAQVLEGVETGAACINVKPNGDNTIVCAAGANAYLTGDHVATQSELLDAADVLLCQFETPVESLVWALQRASELGKTTILNPSPQNTEFPWGQVAIDFLIVNERESAALFGYFVQDTNEAPQLRGQMADLGVSTLIITRGADPTIVISAHQAFKVPPPAAEVVDTTGAGDAFAGAFAVHWAKTHNLLVSIRKANISAAISTERLGAQESLPTFDEVENFGSVVLPSSFEVGQLVVGEEE